MVYALAVIPEQRLGFESSPLPERQVRRPGTSSLPWTCFALSMLSERQRSSLQHQYRYFTSNCQSPLLLLIPASLCLPGSYSHQYATTGSTFFTSLDLFSICSHALSPSGTLSAGISIASIVLARAQLGVKVGSRYKSEDRGLRDAK